MAGMEDLPDYRLDEPDLCIEPDVTKIRETYPAGARIYFCIAQAELQRLVMKFLEHEYDEAGHMKWHGLNLGDDSCFMQREILSDVFESLKTEYGQKSIEDILDEWHRVQAKTSSWSSHEMCVKLRESTELMIFQHVYYTKLGGHTTNTGMITTQPGNGVRDHDSWLENHVLELIYRAAARPWKMLLLPCLRVNALNDKPADVETTALGYLARDWQ
jgi:hypothetical protein